MSARILLYTGKGGVGKTTCAAATALRAAEQGRRTLVLSTDPAHSLADALDVPLGPEPREVAPNLFAQEVDLYYSMQKHWSSVRQLLLLVFKWQGLSDIAAEELAAIPGMGEASALLWLDQFYREGTYDLIVVDSAPTGETLTFLSLPQVTEWWITKAFPFQKLAMQGVGFAVRKTTGIPLDKGYQELTRLFEKLKLIHEVMSDPATCSVRLVMNPEKMVIQEARRAYTSLQLYGYGVDAVVVNRVLPQAAAEGGWGAYLEAQARYLEEIDQSFSPLPILQVPHRQREVFGLDLLRAIGRDLFPERDPADVFYAEQPFRVRRDGAAYVVEIRLPFTEAADADVRVAGDQLVVKVQNQRRHYLLPTFLGYYRFAGHTLDGGLLRVRFEGGEG